MEKNSLRQLEALVNSFTFYPKRFFKKPLCQALWSKIRFFTWNCTPPVGQKSEIAPKFFSRLFILGLALSITKVSTRSGCYIWDTSLVSFTYLFIKLFLKKMKTFDFAIFIRKKGAKLCMSWNDDVALSWLVIFTISELLFALRFALLCFAVDDAFSSFIFFLSLCFDWKCLFLSDVIMLLKYVFFAISFTF